MKIQLPLVHNVDTWEELRRQCDKCFGDISSAINGRISLTDNAETSSVSLTFGAANTEVSTRHGLGRTPSGYIQIGASAGITVFDGSNSNSSDTIFLKATGAGTVRVLVF